MDFSGLAGLTPRRQPLLLHTNPIMRSARFKTEPIEFLGELTGKAESLNFTQRKVCEANQWSYILNSLLRGEGKTRDQGYTHGTQRQGV